MEHADLWCSQQPATEPCYELNKPKLQPHTIFHKIHFNNILSSGSFTYKGSRSLLIYTVWNGTRHPNRTLSGWHIDKFRNIRLTLWLACLAWPRNVRDHPRSLGRWVRQRRTQSTCGTMESYWERPNQVAIDGSRTWSAWSSPLLLPYLGAYDNG
jgi:hypothetical protein